MGYLLLVRLCQDKSVPLWSRRVPLVEVCGWKPTHILETRSESIGQRKHLVPGMAVETAFNGRRFPRDYRSVVLGVAEESA